MRPEPTLSHTDSAEAELDAVAARVHALVLEMTERQLIELARMREAGMRHIDLIDKRVQGRLKPEQERLFGKRGAIKDFEVATRALCQIMVLEREIAGLRPSKRKITWPPRLEDFPGVSEEALKEHTKRHRFNTREYYDYRPVGEVIDWIRTTLEIEPPPNDPFLPPPLNVTADAAETPEAEDEIAAKPPAPRKRQRAARSANNDRAILGRSLPHAWEIPDAGNRRRQAARGPP